MRRLAIVVLILSYSHCPPLYTSHKDFPVTSLYRNDLVNADVIYYFTPQCPYAKRIESSILFYANRYRYKVWHFTYPTETFPSPTLRIRIGDAYENYYGVNQIENAINKGK